ncbi:hypothetical protein GCM10020227_55380 [Streptomyces flavovirens]
MPWAAPGPAPRARQARGAVSATWWPASARLSETAAVNAPIASLRRLGTRTTEVSHARGAPSSGPGLPRRHPLAPGFYLMGPAFVSALVASSPSGRPGTSH